MALTIPTPEELPKILEILKKERAHGADGVKEFHSGKPGPRVALTMLTHGNENSTLAAVLPFIKGEIELLNGSVVAVISNLEAANQNKREVENLDFNRFPPDFFDPARAGFYAKKYPDSFARMIALRDSGAFDATHGVDTHNVFNDSDPILLQLKGDHCFAGSIGVPTLITDISVPQRNLDGSRAICLGDFVGGTENRDVPVVEIEGGGPGNSPKVIRGLMSGVLSALASLGMIDPKKYGMTEDQVRQTIYRTSGWAMAPKGFRVTEERFTKAFAPASKGDVLLEDATEEGRAPVVVPEDSRLLFPIPNQDVLDGADDWFYANAQVDERDVNAWVLPENA